MPRPQTVPRIRATVRAPDQMTESQIESLLALGRREAAIIDELEAAVRAGDKDLAWRLAVTLVELQDQARGAGKE